MMSDQNTNYLGDKISVSWNSQLCIHISECGKAKGDLFVADRDPWCQPDLVSVDDVIDIVKRCPSGALSFQSKATLINETAEAENTLVVSNNGPYYLRGELEIDATTNAQQGTAFRAALCRCGASKIKPFCDNSHNDIGFTDTGAVGEKGEILTSSGGKLTITQAENGPLILKGNLTIQNGSGRVAWSGTQVALCRCGASNNKPFCDGSHVGIDFKSAQ